MRVLGRAEEALAHLAEVVGCYCPPELVLEAERWLDDLREALREGAEASRALEACRARERLSSQERLRLKEAVIRAREILERV